MASKIPLFSRGRPLKNLLADWYHDQGNRNILLEGDLYAWDLGSFYEFNESYEEKALYDAVINKWYFANIGFDTDDEFVFRFNAVWRANIEHYRQAYAFIKYKSAFTSKTSKELQLSESFEGSSDETGSREVSTVKSGEDTFVKGVTTTSDQSTSNQGNKLARQTPNEQLGVTGESHTTVQDSGSDKNQYDSQVVTTEAPNIEKTNSHNKNNSVAEETYHEEMSPTILRQLYSVPSVMEAFAMLFEKLFLGVF